MKLCETKSCKWWVRRYGHLDERRLWEHTKGACIEAAWLAEGLALILPCVAMGWLQKALAKFTARGERK